MQTPSTSQPIALIVEDETPLRVMFSRCVESHGYETFVASNGQDALSFLSHNTPRLIFLDMLLPIVNGIEVLQYIASEVRFAGTHVVLMSSSSSFGNYQHSIRSAEFRLKPLLPSHIQSIITNINNSASIP